MSTPPGPPFPDATQANFNEPTNNDQTSTPPDNPPQGAQIQQVLGQRKKKAPFGPKVKNPGALASAIARAKKARQTGDKYG